MRNLDFEAHRPIWSRVDSILLVTSLHIVLTNIFAMQPQYPCFLFPGWMMPSLEPGKTQRDSAGRRSLGSFIMTGAIRSPGSIHHIWWPCVVAPPPPDNTVCPARRKNAELSKKWTRMEGGGMREGGGGNNHLGNLQIEQRCMHEYSTVYSVHCRIKPLLYGMSVAFDLFSAD